MSSSFQPENWQMLVTKVILFQFGCNRFSYESMVSLKKIEVLFSSTCRKKKTHKFPYITIISPVEIICNYIELLFI